MHAQDRKINTEGTTFLRLFVVDGNTEPQDVRLAGATAAVLSSLTAHQRVWNISKDLDEMSQVTDGSLRNTKLTASHGG